MGYLSCKAQSSISTSDSHISTPAKQTPSNQKTSEKQKPKIIQEFNYKELLLATNSFSKSNLLGKGSHGLVYKGVLQNGQHVAIKKPSRNNQRSNLSQNPHEIDNEIDILSRIHSHSLVNLVGFTKKESNERLLVVEFMSNGTLYDLLHVSSSPPNWGRRIKLALQTAKAIETLHSLNPPVVHRDIKSANVLIDRNFNAKLGDFGLALRCVDDYKLRSTPPAGTMGYLDPCYVTPENLSTKNDVFSFGILLFEIISGRKAIDMGYSPPCIVDWAVPLIRNGKLLAIYDPRILPPKDAPVRKMLAVVAAKCVRSCRERRPSMKEVVEFLSELSRLVPIHSWNGFVNPCLMVENVGRPVHSRNVNLRSVGLGGENGKFFDEDSKVSRNSRRVYLDLGMQNNLLELMAGVDVESKVHGEECELGSENKLVKERSKTGRGTTSIRSMVVADGKGKTCNLS